MLTRILLIVLCAVPMVGSAQALSGLNYRYFYDPENELDFKIKAVNDKSRITVYYSITPTNGQDKASDFTVSWDHRENYIQKEGTRVTPSDSSASGGKLSFPAPEKAWLLVAHIINSKLDKRWTYFQVIDAKYPVDGYLEDGGQMVFAPYIRPNKPYTVRGAQPDKPVHFYFYKTNFTAANPPFADKDTQTDRFLFADSSFHVENGSQISLKSQGLYLAQQDTSSAQGFSFRVTSNSFPKFAKAEEIPAPLVFITTADEADELVAAKDDKSKIDKVILDITGGKDRAKNFMKSYFRRAELTNVLFSNYKEGWKTDMGMIFLIFGLPDEVSRTGANEIWNYKSIHERFTFLRSGSVYDPQHYNLMRNSKFQITWYSTIDLWRKAQF